MVTWNFVELDEVGSTQAVAKGLAAMGAPEGTAVVAKSQTSGEGRMGRGWVSPAGGLYMSIILRPQDLSRPELATLVSSVAVVRGIRNATGLSPTIRWPNDVMIKGKKLGGVIAEAQSYKQEITQIIVGIGVNCNAPVSGVESLENVATSLREELGRNEEISVIKLAVLGSFSQLYESWKGGGDVAESWRESVGTLGKQVLVKLKTEENPFSCLAKQIDEAGNLVAEGYQGTLVIRAEDLEWLKEQP